MSNYTQMYLKLRRENTYKFRLYTNKNRKLHRKIDTVGPILAVKAL